MQNIDYSREQKKFIIDLENVFYCMFHFCVIQPFLAHLNQSLNDVGVEVKLLWMFYRFLIRAAFNVPNEQHCNIVL